MNVLPSRQFGLHKVEKHLQWAIPCFVNYSDLRIHRGQIKVSSFFNSTSFAPRQDGWNLQYLKVFHKGQTSPIEIGTNNNLYLTPRASYSGQNA